MGVTDIGRKSEHATGLGILATGVITLHFHYCGICAELRDLLYISDKGLARKELKSLKNHEGRLSSPGGSFFQGVKHTKNPFLSDPIIMFVHGDLTRRSLT